ncbi:MFS transporter [Actinomadura madurae]|uniref:MFS transporter n=1 Tax=Actinomadura madurae TaxID=1993 RepID=UPI0020D20E9A|nr:MFS transporter [Actinomadura madurae]MCP9977128.1 MFS transporter [Actinomadura madurae]
MLCAVSGSLPVLIGGRALQGVSAALIPLSIGMIRDTFPAERVTTAIGIVSATMGVGGSAGMIVTGLIATRTSSHHPVFWVAAVLAAAVLVLVAVTARDVGVRAGGRPDVVGAAVLAVWLAALLLGISQGNAWGWTSGRVLGLFGGAAVLCAAWVVIELRVRAPLVRLNLLVGPRSLSANVISALLGFSMFAAFTLIAGFVQAPSAELGYGLDGSVLDVGLYMLPSTATMLVFSAMAAGSRPGSAPPTRSPPGPPSPGCATPGSRCRTPIRTTCSPSAPSRASGSGSPTRRSARSPSGTSRWTRAASPAGSTRSCAPPAAASPGAATASILAGRVVAGSGAPTLGAYETCFWIVAAGAALAALIAVAHALRHPV